MTAMISIMQAWAWANGRILQLCKYLVTACVGVMTLVIIVQVFFRYALNDALAWSEELARYMMVWMTFLALPIISSKLAHSSLTLFSDLLPPKARTLLKLVVYGICALVMFVAVQYSLDFAAKGMRILASSLPFHKVWAYAAMPLGFGLAFSVYMELLCKTVIAIISAQGKATYGTPVQIQENHQMNTDL